MEKFFAAFEIFWQKLWAFAYEWCPFLKEIVATDEDPVIR